jgi:hypothetical protein
MRWIIVKSNLKPHFGAFARHKAAIHKGNWTKAHFGTNFMTKPGRRNAVIVVLWLLISVIATPGGAADLRLDPSDPLARTMVFEGAIAPGDFAR